MNELPSLKIAMVGTSNTGKTCYLYGTYIRLLEGIGKFNFCSSNYRQGLQLRNNWQTFLRDQRWPQGTNESSEYKFNALLKGKKIADFTWMDYRGGLLDGSVSQANELDDFLATVSNANGIIVCIPADLLMLKCTNSGKDTDGSNAHNAIGVDDILLCYNEVLQGLTELSIPIVLTITKGDIIKTKEEYKTVIKYLKTKFQVLFQENSPAVMIARVRLGKFTPNQVQGGEIEGKVDPKNLHVPILFPIWMALDAQNQELNRQIYAQNSLQRKNQGDLSKANERGYFGRVWYGDPRPELQKQKEEIQSMISSLGMDQKALQESMDSIKKEFEGNADIFMRGKCVLNGTSFVED